jgi:hypothetical protein
LKYTNPQGTTWNDQKGLILDLLLFHHCNFHTLAFGMFTAD